MLVTSSGVLYEILNFTIVTKYYNIIVLYFTIYSLYTKVHIKLV